MIQCQEVATLLDAELWRSLVGGFRSAVLEIPHKRFDLIAGECLPECGHRSPTVQNLLTQLALILPASDTTEIWSFVPTDPADRVALGAPFLMKLCRATLGSGFTSTISRKRQSDNQNQDEAVEYLNRYSQWPFSSSADDPMSISL